MSDALVVIADSGPIIALAYVDQLDVLRALYGRVVIPEEVAAELLRGHPKAGWNAVSACPWMEVRRPVDVAERLVIASLDKGEAQAISLALAVPSALLILDDLRARRIATGVYDLDIIGTLGVLTQARQRALIGPLAPVITRLVEAGIHLSAPLIAAALRRVGEQE